MQENDRQYAPPGHVVEPSEREAQCTDDHTEGPERLSDVRSTWENEQGQVPDRPAEATITVAPTGDHEHSVT